MKIRVETPNGVEQNLNVNQLISIDGVPFSQFVRNGSLDPGEVQSRLTIVEAALSTLVAEWTEFKQTAELIPGEPEDDRQSNTGVHAVRDNDSG